MKTHRILSIKSGQMEGNFGEKSKEEKIFRFLASFHDAPGRLLQVLTIDRID